MTLLRADHLIKRYGGLTVTDDVSMTVNAGEIHAVIGPNGAGKTTLIGQLSGEIKSNSGTIIFDGNDITALPIEQRVRRGLARSYQITSVFPDFTALQNVALAVQAQRGHSFRFWQPTTVARELNEPAQHALDMVGLASRAHTRVGDMAHGEHRQLELAMALACEPRMLLLDEPMAGMSQRESETMTELLLRLRGKYAMLLVEHDMEAVFALSDCITVLVYGKKIASGTSDEIRRNEDVKTAYLGDEDDDLAVHPAAQEA
jgi:branched-chain amino acid transport system ATP-binding protein